jgi:taurine dioxygenase
VAIHTRALPGIGLEVLGLDLSHEITKDTVHELREIWKKAGVVLFRGVGTSPEALLHFSRCFGDLEPHPFENIRLPGYPELILLTNKGGPRGPVYAFDGVPTCGRIPWHTDLAFKTVPNAGALLNMVEKAEIGGHTAWLDTALAYEALDEALKRQIDGLEARFDFCADLSRMRFNNPGGIRIGDAKSDFPDYPPIARPIVWNHPETSRKILNICPLNIQGIIGMDDAASETLIKTLIDAVTQPQFIYEHAWEDNDIVLWDNYRMMHSAVGHRVDVTRVVHRTTLRGQTTVGRIMEPTNGRDGV